VVDINPNDSYLCFVHAIVSSFAEKINHGIFSEIVISVTLVSYSAIVAH
jgi:hypothetical protein